MKNNPPSGYAGQLLWVDLTSRRLSQIDTATHVPLKLYLGGTGLGMRILYDNVPPKVQWNEAQNLLILATGPLNGTRIAGTGTVSIVTKGAMTNGATSTQASGFMGAYLKHSGFDAIVLEGIADQWSYLYLHNGVAELRSASHLVGKDTNQTEESIRKELGAKRLSIFSIGPAGENLVRFACIVSGKTHVAAHNGVGAVMGAKKLKAIVASGEPVKPLAVHDPSRLSQLSREVLKSTKEHPIWGRWYEWGTSRVMEGYSGLGLLPVKNYTTNELPPDIDKFSGTYYRERFHIKRNPCWACQFHHCHTLEVTEGPYSGYIAEEPEYEQWTAWGPQIGVFDPGAVVVLSDEADKLGLDANEGSWVIGMVMECFEKGIITKSDTDGLIMTWGNIEAVRAMLRKITSREGIGNVLAQGAKEASKLMGGDVPNMGVYTLKGTTPRAHDDRGNWLWMLDHCTSNTSVSETLVAASLATQGYLMFDADPLDPEAVPKAIVSRKGIMQFEDSLIICFIAGGPYLEPLIQMTEAVTGWQISIEEALDIGLRIVHLMKAFNVRHGLTTEMDFPSPRYGSSQTDGPLRARSALPDWSRMLHSYYTQMGWDYKSGRPLPQTLSKFSLDGVAKDLWGTSSDD